MTAAFERNARDPIFFVSYAHASRAKGSARGFREADGPVLRFFDDLSAHVTELVGSPAGADPGFLDRSMDGGERWSSQLLAAAGTCQVFIPLISDTYLRSRWCGLEWNTFSRRRVVNREHGEPDNETAILPVTWSSIHIPQPEVIRAVQRFTPLNLRDLDISPRYQREGIYGLLTLKDDVAYRSVMWRLAQRVADLYYSHYVEPQIPADSEALRDAFREKEK